MAKTANQCFFIIEINTFHKFKIMLHIPPPWV
jgi:hypothetical protein